MASPATQSEFVPPEAVKALAMSPKPEPFPYPEVELIEEDGVPLETDWHRRAMNLLIEIVLYHMRGREDFFVGGNMFIYFNEQQARDRDYRGPVFFFVRGASLNPPRPYWAIWKEGGKYPDLIIELASPSTIQEDRTTKKNIYEDPFHTHEYFIFDPSTGNLEGWRHVDARYKPLKLDKNGRLECKELGLWLGKCDSKYQGREDIYPRFFDKDGKLVPTDTEAETQRADAAEAELARLKAQLANRGQQG